MNRIARAAAATALAASALLTAGCVDNSPIPTALDVGVCFDNYYTDQGILQGFQIGRCSVPHDAELVLKYDATDGDFDVSALVTEAVARCGAAFADFVGIDPKESKYDFDAFMPTESQWGQGERQVFCYAYSPDGKIKGSVRGAAE